MTAEDLRDEIRVLEQQVRAEIDRAGGLEVTLVQARAELAECQRSSAADRDRLVRELIDLRDRYNRLRRETFLLPRP